MKDKSKEIANVFFCIWGKDYVLQGFGPCDGSCPGLRKCVVWVKQSALLCMALFRKSRDLKAGIKAELVLVVTNLVVFMCSSL